MRKNLFLATCLFSLLAIACQKTPETIDVESITLNQTSLSLTVGDSFELKAKVLPKEAEAQYPVIWKSKASEIVSVTSSGVLTAMAPGETTVSAYSHTKEATCTIRVIEKILPVSSVSLSVQSASLLVGETLQLTATVLPADASDKTVTWSSSDEGIVTVMDGLVKALSSGEATITATAGDLSATCLVTVSVPFSYDGMCLESIGNGSIRISNTNQLTIDYKIEEEDWTSVSSASIVIETKAKQRVWFRGLNETYSKINPNDEKNYIETTISCQGGDYYLYGNLMSLIYGDDFESKTEMTGEHAFFRLFFNNTRLVNHPTKDILLPATTLSPSCYQNMFFGCAKLTRAPKLPAKVLTESCYASMFAYCSALKEFPEMDATEMAYMSCTWMMMGSGIEQAPELPAMTLAHACYEFMFMECPNLKKGPSVLPATELASTCYTGMFQRCEKLEEAPVLPATELKYSCYSHMFNGCKSLKKAPKLPATSLAEACYQRMFGNSGLDEAPELPAMGLEVMCYQYMFEGCTSLEKAPVLPATTLNYWCYEKMFNGCSSMNYIKMMGIQVKKDTWTGYKLVDLTNDNIGSYCTEWVNGVAASGTFVKNPEAVWNTVGVNGIPEGWTVQQ